MDPVLPVIQRCAAQATEAASGAPDLRDRIDTLLAFVERFDHGVGVFVRGDPHAIERLFVVLQRLDAETVERLWDLVDTLAPNELQSALEAVVSLPPGAIRRLIGLADQPALRKLLGLR
jgi:hypothetical protein